MKAGKDFIGVGCGALIFNEKGEILLVKRSKNSRTEPGIWARPGGEVEFHESIEVAVVRETFEETGIIVKPICPLEFMDVISEDGSTHWVALGYLAEYISGEITNREPEKHDDVRWFPLDDIPDNLAKYTRNSINFYQKYLS